MSDWWSADPVAPSAPTTAQLAPPFWAADPVASDTSTLTPAAPLAPGQRPLMLPRRPTQQELDNLNGAPTAPTPTPDDLNKILPGMGGPGSAFNDVSTMVTRGQPVVDSIYRGLPFSDRLDAAVDSGVQAASGQPVTYNANLQAARDAGVAAMKANPVGESIGNFVGSMAGPAAIMGPIAGAPSLIAKVGQGVKYGTALGAAQGLSAAPDWSNVPQTAIDTAGGAIAGGVVGGAAVPVGAAVGFGAKNLANYLTPSAAQSPAERLVTQNVIADDPAAVQAKLNTLGPQGMLVDAGPSLQGVGQGLMQPGAPRTIMTDALRARQAGMTGRVGSDVDTALGVPLQTPQAATDALQAQRGQLHAQLPQIFASAPDIDTSNVLATIGQQLVTAPEGSAQRSALLHARNLLTQPVPGSSVMRIPVTDAQTLANAKVDLGNLIDFGNPGLGVPSGALKQANGAAKTVYGQLNQALRDQVPGYGDIMDQSSTLAGRMQAIEAGTKALPSGPSTAIAPPDFTVNFAKLPPDQQLAYQFGMRQRLAASLGSNPNDAQALKSAMQGEGGWNAANLGTASGPGAQPQLENTLAREQTFADTQNRLINNSQTAQRLAGEKALEEAQPKPPFQTGLQNLTLTGIPAEGFRALGNAVAAASQQPIDNAAVARILTLQGPARASALADMLQAYAAQQRNAAIGSKVGNAATLAALMAPEAGAVAARRNYDLAR